MADKFLIAPYNQESGQVSDVKPWLISDSAFEELRNAYVFRGRVRKRFGTQWLANDFLGTRLRIQIGVGPGHIVTTTPAHIAPAVGQMFSCGNETYTVNALGNPANLLINGLALTATYDTTTRAVDITNAPAAPLYYYPALPVMGLLTADLSTINDEFIIGFDTRSAYNYNNGWYRLDGAAAAGDADWSGTDSQYFWGTTWTGAEPSDRVFFVTNFNQNETHFMRYFTPISNLGQWHQFRPRINTANTIFLESARILVVFKNRLVALNTWEFDTAGVGTLRNYPARARYSWIGSPLAIDAFEQVPGKGNAVDAATTEAIITAEFIKDRLIVYFERSTWELAYTGNQIEPFVWYQINTELGAESTHSIVPFDKVCIGVGNVGIMACNGSNVERIDDKIPQEVFNIHNVDAGVNRVYGIRDYFTETIYWTFPSLTATTTAPYCDRVLVYNYKNNTWAFFDDSITCFGYYHYISSTGTGVTWDSTTVTWDDPISWGGGEIQAKFRYVIAGNQEGFTFMCNPGVTNNSANLQITDIAVAANQVTVTCINHNLKIGDYLFFEGITDLNNLDLINDKIFPVVFVVDAHHFIFNYNDGINTLVTGGYLGGGLISRVSRLSIKTKQFNFYNKQGRNAFFQKVDFLIDRTAYGQIEVGLYSSTTMQNLVTDGTITNSILGTGILDTFAYSTNPLIPAIKTPVPFEETAERLWHPVYLQAEGNVVQFWIRLNDLQMSNTNIRNSDFQMHAMMIHTMPTSYRLS